MTRHTSYWITSYQAINTADLKLEGDKSAILKDSRG